METGEKETGTYAWRKAVEKALASGPKTYDALMAHFRGTSIGPYELDGALVALRQEGRVARACLEGEPPLYVAVGETAEGQRVKQIVREALSGGPLTVIEVEEKVREVAQIADYLIRRALTSLALDGLLARIAREEKPAQYMLIERGAPGKEEVESALEYVQHPEELHICARYGRVLAREIATLRKQLSVTRAAIEKACEIIETGDQRLLASDGPAGGQPPDLSLEEWKELYTTLDGTRQETERTGEETGPLAGAAEAIRQRGPLLVLFLAALEGISRDAGEQVDNTTTGRRDHGAGSHAGRQGEGSSDGVHGDRCLEDRVSERVHPVLHPPTCG